MDFLAPVANEIRATFLDQELTLKLKFVECWHFEEIVQVMKIELWLVCHMLCVNSMERDTGPPVRLGLNCCELAIKNYLTWMTIGIAIEKYLYTL